MFARINLPTGETYLIPARSRGHFLCLTGRFLSVWMAGGNSDHPETIN